MKDFLKSLILFLLPIILLIYPIDIGVSYILKNSHENPGEFEVWNDIYSSDLKLDIAIYGSSRAWVHLDPNILIEELNQSTYNFGVDGSNFSLQYLTHLEYFKHNHSPKHIILSLDLFTLQEKNDLYEAKQFLPYMLYNKNINNYLSSYNYFNEMDYIIPLIRYSGRINTLELNFETICNPTSNIKLRNKGYKGINRKWNEDDFEKTKSKIQPFEIKIDEQLFDLLQNFIEECKEKNINLTLVYTPDYIEGHRFILNRDYILNLYVQLAQKNNLNFYDFSNDIISSNKDYFYNAMHLNKTGAEAFTKKLALILKESD